MSHPHPHPEVSGQVVSLAPATVEQLQGELADANAYIEVLREKYQNLDNDQTVRIAAIRARERQLEQLNRVLAAISRENQLLRGRLGLAAAEPIELTDEEAVGLPEDAVTEVPDTPEH